MIVSDKGVVLEVRKTRRLFFEAFRRRVLAADIMPQAFRKYLLLQNH